VADRTQRLRAGRLADDGRLIDLPVAGVEHVSERRFNEDAVALRNGVRKGDEADAERTEFNASAALHGVELDAAVKPLLLQLARNQARRERSSEQRRLELICEIRKRTDMILVPVRQNDAGEPFLLVFDEFQIG